MKFLLPLLALNFLTIFSCTNNKIKIVRQPTAILSQQEIDTTQYADLPYYTGDMRRFSDAYIDTFSVGSNKFRFVNPIATHRTGGNSIYLQQLLNGKWVITNLTLEDNVHGGNFFYEDINGDGYIDIVNWQRFTGLVYFYNPNINSFIDTPANEEVNQDWVLLDKAKNIYCDFQDFKQMCGQIHSKLYRYKGFERIDLFDLNLYNCTETNYKTNLITKLILSRCIGGDTDSTVVVEETKLNKPIDIDNYGDGGKYPNGTDSYFDYKKYWLNRYKELINIKKH